MKHTPTPQRVFVLLLAALLLGTGCSDPSTGSPTAPADEDTFSDDFEGAPIDERGEVVLTPQTLLTGRSARRLSVDNLRRSIPLLFGDITWTVTVQGREINTFDGLARTLGEADYIQMTESNTTPNPLFAKFMDDMAGQVCGKAIAQDEDTREASDRLVVRFPQDVDENLRFMRLKFHGLYVPEDSPEGLEDLRRLYDDILTDTDDFAQAWEGVCIAMLTSPEFMAY